VQGECVPTTVAYHIDSNRNFYLTSLLFLCLFTFGVRRPRNCRARQAKNRGNLSLSLLFVLVCECVESRERERGSIGTCRNWRFPFETMVGKKIKSFSVVWKPCGGGIERAHTHTYTLLLIEFSPFFHRAEDDADVFSSSRRLSK